MKRALTLGVGILLGAGGIALTASCMPSDPVEHFEDGSWLNHDTGEQGCDPEGLCADLPPVPDGQPVTENGGYFPTLTLIPCAQEDSVNCYWDAARMGNGEGTSFVNIDGTMYYPR